MLKYACVERAKIIRWDNVTSLFTYIQKDLTVSLKLPVDDDVLFSFPSLKTYIYIYNTYQFPFLSHVLM